VSRPRRTARAVSGNVQAAPNPASALTPLELRT
jgi:hypothetical protein